jgi:CheY-like chemotaxis protein
MANVLIVDDNADDRETLAEVLRLGGHHATTVPNGREALVLVIQEPPDVVLLDLIMPEMDGPSFLEVARSYLRLQALPVVIYTGMSDSPMIDRARALKVNSILAKGKASPEEILRAIDEAIARLPG